MGLAEVVGLLEIQARLGTQAAHQVFFACPLRAGWEETEALVGMLGPEETQEEIALAVLVALGETQLAETDFPAEAEVRVIFSIVSARLTLFVKPYLEAVAGAVELELTVPAILAHLFGLAGPEVRAEAVMEEPEGSKAIKAA